jgi:hypothetical protein
MSSERSRQSDLAVMDANELKQKRRLKRLLDVREKVEQKADEADEFYVAGKIDERARDTMILRAVKEYIRETWTLLLNHAREMRENEGRESEYLETRKLGVLEVGEREIQFEGLISVLHAEELYEDYYQQEVVYPQGPNETVTRRVVESVPRSVSWQAFLCLNEFLAEEHGIQLQFEPSDQSIQSFGFETIDVDVEDLDAPTIEELEEQVETALDMRAITEGDDDGDN